MAVKYVEKKTLLEPEELCGLSSDTKPVVDLSGQLLRPMASFYELDTKKVYLFDGISTWY